MPDMIRIHPKDNVAVALRDLPAGSVFDGIFIHDPIPRGHKVALQSIAPDESVVKYGFPIGHATAPIASGHWVHTHNMATNLSDDASYAYQPDVHFPRPAEPENFSGYRRPNGTVGIRNEIWIIPTVGCVNDVAKTLAAENQDLVCGTIDGLYAFPHPFGCSQTGHDHARTRKLLAALARHPNAGAVLILGLGCENLTQEQFIQELGEFDSGRVKFLICQQVSDELTAGRTLLQQCADFAGRFQRESVPVSELIIGMKCGGSDGLSGVTANPVVGHLTDLLTARGGSAILTEVPEMFGAEDLLLNRCISQSVFRKAADMLEGFRNYYVNHGEPVYENPSPGNKAGGITTLEEKSCGCVQKGGSAPIVDVIAYGSQVSVSGLNLLDGPGNDLVSSTALTAAGAHMVLFTTGRGTPFGAPAPTIKIATNSELATRKANWIDFNAGNVADGSCSIEESAAALLDLVIQTASGRPTRSEEQGFREIAIFKSGVML